MILLFSILKEFSLKSKFLAVIQSLGDNFTPSKLYSIDADYDTTDTNTTCLKNFEDSSHVLFELGKCLNRFILLSSQELSCINAIIKNILTGFKMVRVLNVLEKDTLYLLILIDLMHIILTNNDEEEEEKNCDPSIKLYEFFYLNKNVIVF